MTGSQPVVLVVEDEPDVAETYEIWLAGDYRVRRAESGRVALDDIDDDVDVVLLDRMMAELSGDEVLAEIRERGYDCAVAMVSAVDPDFDIIEMGFDDYVTKPPTREGLRETVAALVDREERTADVREYRSLVNKRAALEAEMTESELQASEEYERLEGRIDRLEAALESDRDRYLDDAEFVSTLRDVVDEGDGTDEDGNGGDRG